MMADYNQCKCIPAGPLEGIDAKLNVLVAEIQSLLSEVEK